MRNTGQAPDGITGTPGVDVRAEAAWDVTTGSKSIIVGVVDSGVDYTHSDLAPNVWSNPGGTAGCPAGSHGYNAVASNCDPMDDVPASHGTHVSGILGAAGNNGIGVAGVNWTTNIMGLKAFDAAGNTNIARLIAAIDFAVRAKSSGVNVRVLNCSWGLSSFSQGLLDEINIAGAHDILVVAAAPDNTSQNVDVTPDYPSSYHAGNVISVTGIDNADRLFGGFGAGSVHIAAPAFDILSTVRGGGYGYLSGTSMAAPFVTGAIALLFAAQPTLTSSDAKSMVVGAAAPDPAVKGITVSGGRLDICRSIPGCPRLKPEQIVAIISAILQ
jgi:subtilisin family serine protease